jgi:hypothetical protein
LDRSFCEKRPLKTEKKMKKVEKISKNEKTKPLSIKLYGLRPSIKKIMKVQPDRSIRNKYRSIEPFDLGFRIAPAGHRLM